LTETAKKVTQNSEITIHFSLSLADSTVVDGTQDGQPMSFTMSDGTMIAAFENVILGLSVGDKQQVSLDPRDTFGFPDEDNKHWLQKTDFDAEMTLEEGLMIEFSTPAGERLPGMVVEMNDDKVLVDFNHPLAGHELIFAVQVVDILS